MASASGSTGPPTGKQRQPRDWVGLSARVGLPVFIALVGVVLIVMGHASYAGVISNVDSQDSVSTDFQTVITNRDSVLSALGVVFLVIALMVWMLNWLMHMNTTEAADRAKEDDARRYFLEHGHWPDEPR